MVTLNESEDNGAESLVLSRGSNMVLIGRIDEVGLQLFSAHAFGMAFVMEEDETLDPVQVGLVGAIGVMFSAQGGTDQIHKFGRLGFHISHCESDCTLSVNHSIQTPRRINPPNNWRFMRIAYGVLCDPLKRELGGR